MKEVIIAVAVAMIVVQQCEATEKGVPLLVVGKLVCSPTGGVEGIPKSDAAKIIQ
jgi:hypothetical protein